MELGSLAESLREIRIEKRMTQRELAIAAGVSRRTISTLENEAMFVTVNQFSLNKVLEVMGYSLAVIPARPPTLQEVLQDAGRLQPHRAAKHRVRKMLSEL